MRHTFFRMDLLLLDERLAAGEQPGFRARQVWEWAARGAGSYEEMTNLPLELREQLAGEVPFSSLTPVREALASDGTEKALFETHDGRPVEAVLMRYRDGRRSLCVSSQSGCPLTCTFCATGAMRFGRNLTASEILDQALHFRRKEPVNHAVFMGMGEPLMNLDAVLAACERLPDVGIAHSNTGDLDRRLDPGHRPHGRGGTAGAAGAVAPRGRRGAALRADAGERPLSAARRARRLPALARAPQAPGVRRVPDARRRERPLRAGAWRSRTLLEPRHAFKVNLIPYNPTDSGYRGSGRDAIAAFRAALEERGVRTTVRLTRGRDIAAACGQLAARG